MERVDTLVIDKTGTLTEGRPEVVAIRPADGFDEAEILRLVASVERASEHPLAAAIVRAAEARRIATATVGGFGAPTGKGAQGEVEGRRVTVGTSAYLSEQGIATPALDTVAESLRQDGATAVLVGVDGRPAAAIAIADPVKTSAGRCPEGPEGGRNPPRHADGRPSHDRRGVARKLGITEIEAEILPAEKGRVVERYRKQGRVVAMAGDGVNDAPALAAADVGIAMGTGTDVAIESAGVTLLRGDLAGLVGARRLSKAVMSNIRQNLVFAFVYNATGVPIAAGVLYPIFGILLSPVIAAAAMSLSSVSVIGNALSCAPPSFDVCSVPGPRAFTCRGRAAEVYADHDPAYTAAVAG